MNCKVKADFPTPPLPTMITLWRASEFCPFGLAAAMVTVAMGQDRQESCEVGRSGRVGSGQGGCEDAEGH